MVERRKRGRNDGGIYDCKREKLLRMQSEHCNQAATELALHIPKIPILDALPAHLIRSTIL